MDDLGSSSPLSAPEENDSSSSVPPPPHNSDQNLNSSINNTSPSGPGWAPPAGTPVLTASGVPRKKPGPKPKKTDDPPNGEKPVKKARKPRDPNAPPRKKQKKSEEAGPAPQPQKLGFGLASSSTTSGNGAAQNPEVQQSQAPSLAAPASNEKDQKPLIQIHQPASTQTQPQPRPPLSGQRYDPIRSASAENARLAKGPTHARASPSIASLIDPPTAVNTPPPNVTSAPRPNDMERSKPASPVAPKSADIPQKSADNTSATNGTNLHPDAASKPVVNGKSASPSRATSPKPARKKKEPPPLPPGNGLLSGSDFGKPSASDRVFAEVPNQCIVIEVPITGESNNYVNFIKEVEAKYGFDVAHPRLAEHRRRMAQMAAAGAALESGAASADDMALDGSDMDSNVEMGGMEDDSSPGDAAKSGEPAKKKRARRGDEYDKNDDFIDDTEQAWEEQALASRDGYFVWSGPLIAEGDKPTVERADGTVKRGRSGRGRGGATRGEGSARGRGTGAKRGGAAGGGRGSRGGATGTRKSRLTKAAKEEMESEKVERQKLAASMAKPAVHQGIIGM